MMPPDSLIRKQLFGVEFRVSAPHDVRGLAVLIAKKLPGHEEEFRLATEPMRTN